MRTATRDVTVADDRATAEAALRLGLLSLGARSSGGDAAGRIEARTGSSVRSLGERIRVDMIPVEAGTQVRVRVETVIGATLVDYGATKRVADHLVRAVSDPVWARRVAAEVGRPVLPPALMWLGVAVAAVAAGLAWMPAAAYGRSALLIAAALAGALWAAALLSRSLRIRRRGDFSPPWLAAVLLGGTLVIGLTVSDALKPRHAGLALTASADLSSWVGALALTTIVVSAVLRIRSRRRSPAAR